MTICQEKQNLLVGQYLDTYLPVIDGVINTVQNYARWLNTDHFPCYIAAPAAPRGYVDLEPYPIIRYRSVPIKKRPPYRYGLPWLDRRFMNLEIDLSPSLIHAHAPFAAGEEARRIAHQRKIPLVASFHSKYYDDILQATGNKFLAEQAVQLIVHFYHHADHVWTANSATARTLRDYGFQKSPEIMPIGSDLLFPEDREAAIDAVNLRFGLKADEDLMLFVGQLILQKNLAMLLDAAILYKRSGGKFKLLMVGEGYAQSELNRKAEEAGLGDDIIFAGLISDRSLLSAIYLRADLFTFPSLYDTAALVIREAATADCPSLLIAGSNASEGIHDGITAYLCENSAESFFQGIQRAFGQPDQRRAIGLQARQSLGRPWRDIVNDVAARYREIIRDHVKK